MTISAKIIADSIGEQSPRLTTLQLRYPKFIHGELMTHRVFSRNASSSRAIPVERLIKDVVEDPVYPSFWGKNQPGMQAKDELNTEISLWLSDEKTNVGHVWSREELWEQARDYAIYIAKGFSAAGYHKQIVNRLLEPFCHINVVVTATEWSNFFALRCHPDAQPEMRLLAEAIKSAIERSEPQKLDEDEWHLPYIPSDDGCGHRIKWNKNIDDVTSMIKVSVARCARVSYLTQDNKTPTIEEDLKLYDRLMSSVPLHASPAEHQATPDISHGDDHGPWQQPKLHGNLRGWVQHRKTLHGESQ